MKTGVDLGRKFVYVFNKTLNDTENLTTLIYTKRNHCLCCKIRFTFSSFIR